MLTPEGRPLYAGHADLPWPDEPLLELWHGVTLLREHRGDGHLAVAAARRALGPRGADHPHRHRPRLHRGSCQGHPRLARRGVGRRLCVLTDRGLLDDAGLTADGKALRAQVEAETDALSAAPWRAPRCRAHRAGDRAGEGVRPRRWSPTAPSAPGSSPAGDRAGAAALRARGGRDRGPAARPPGRRALRPGPAAPAQPAGGEGWNALLGALRSGTTLPADLRELIILRVAVLNGAAFEWTAHEPIARRAGLDDGQLAALREPDAGRAPVWTPVQAAVLAFTDASTTSVAVAEPVFAALRAHLDERQVVEVTATVGGYAMVSRFLVALEVPPPRRRGRRLTVHLVGGLDTACHHGRRPADRRGDGRKGADSDAQRAAQSRSRGPPRLNPPDPLAVPRPDGGARRTSRCPPSSPLPGAPP